MRTWLKNSASIIAAIFLCYLCYDFGLKTGAQTINQLCSNNALTESLTNSRFVAKLVQERDEQARLKMLTEFNIETVRQLAYWHPSSMGWDCNRSEIETVSDLHKFMTSNSLAKELDQESLAGLSICGRATMTGEE